MKTNIHTWSTMWYFTGKHCFFGSPADKKSAPWGSLRSLRSMIRAFEWGRLWVFVWLCHCDGLRKSRDWKLQKRWLLCIGSSNTKRKGIDWNVSHEWWICVSKHTVQSEKSSFFPAKSPDIMISLQSFEHFPSFLGEISHWLIFHWLSVSSPVRGSTLNCHRFPVVGDGHQPN